MIETRCIDLTLPATLRAVASPPERAIGDEEDQAGDRPDHAADDHQPVAGLDAGQQVHHRRGEEEQPADEVPSTHGSTLATTFRRGRGRMNRSTPLIAYGDEMIDERVLLRELDSDVERLLERHLDRAKEWFPHDYVPYERGRERREGDWQDTDADLGGAIIDDAVRSSLIVNLLTEDNLPYYFRTVESTLGSDGAWGEWVRRWTAEEGRHSMAIYGYLMTTRAVDPVALERDRMAQVSSGRIPVPPSVYDALVYLSLQELATRIAHRSTGAMIGDPVGHEVMSRVAADENLHHLFYRDLAAAAFKVAPDQMMSAVLRQVSGFEMPGFGIRDFAAHARRIASAGIYDLAVHHKQILVPVVLHQWAVDKMSGLSDAGNKAREALMIRLDKSARVAERLLERRGNAAAAPAL